MSEPTNNKTRYPMPRFGGLYDTSQMLPPTDIVVGNKAYPLRALIELADQHGLGRWIVYREPTADELSSFQIPPE